MLLSCSCGAKIKLPDQTAGKTFRCPKCKTEIEVVRPANSLFPAAPAPVPAAAPAPIQSWSAAPAGGATGETCPICQSSIGAQEQTLRCPSCQQVHHSECWAEVGGCSTYGCKSAPAAEKEETGQDAPLSAWGDNKKCPACGETIKAIALRCRYCGTDFETVDPLTVRDLRRKVHKAEENRGLQKTVVTFFIMAMSGFLSPIALIGTLAAILPRRAELAKSGPFYLVLAYSTLGLSVLYCALMVLFIVAR